MARNKKLISFGLSIVLSVSGISFSFAKENDPSCPKKFSDILQYPGTWRDPIVHEDPYRWLETPSQSRTQWINEQNRLSKAYLAGTKHRKYWDDFLAKIYGDENVITSEKGNGFKLSIVDRGLKRPIEVVLKRGGRKTVLMNSYDYKKNGSFAFVDLSLSPNQDFGVVAVSEKGSLDKYKLVVTRLRKKGIKETLENVQMQDIHWYSPDEFLYRRAFGNETTVFIHKLGTPQSADRVFSEGPSWELQNSKSKKWLVHAGKKDDEISLRNVMSGRTYAIADEFGDIEGEIGNTIVVKQKKGIAFFSPTTGRKWKVRKFETEPGLLIDGVDVEKTHLVASLRYGARRVKAVYDLEGKKLAEYEVPNYARVDRFIYDPLKNEATIDLSSPIQESVSAKYDFKAGKYIDQDPKEALLKRDGIDDE